MIEKKEKFEKKAAVITIYSLLFAFIVNSFVRLIAAKAAGKLMYDVPLFDWYNIIIFAATALLCIFGLYLIQVFGSEKSKIGVLIDNVLASPLTLIVLAVLCFRFWYYPHFQPYTEWYDTSSYANYDYNILLGQVDKFRTPIYPWFLKLVGLITFSKPRTSAFYESVSVFQQIISFAGVIIFYYTAKKLFKNKKIISLITIIYGISPYIISWDMCMLTESLSISAVVLCIFFIVSYLKKPSARLSVTLGIYTLFMVMLRPTFVYMFAVLGVFWLARFILSKADRKQVLCGLIALAVSGCMTLGYCALNKIHNDCFALSNVSTGINKLYMIIDNDIYKNEKYPDITEYIDSRLNDESIEQINYVTDIIEPLNDSVNYSRLADYVNDCVAKNRDVFNSYTLGKAAGILKMHVAEPYYASYNANIEMLKNYGSSAFANFDDIFTELLFPFTFAGCLAAVTISVAFALYQFFSKKLIMWHILGFSAIIFAHFAVSVYGSMAEFQRLCAMILPAMYLLVFWYIDLAIGGYRFSGVQDELYIRGERLSRHLFEKKEKEQAKPQDNADLLSEAQNIADEINNSYGQKQDND